MIQQNSAGQFSGIGYQAGKSLTLVRNPNWSASTYASAAYKPPAYLNKINVIIGGDTTVIGDTVLKGSDMVQLDTPSQPIVKEAYLSYPSQITFIAGAGTPLRRTRHPARAVHKCEPASCGLGGGRP